MTIEVREVIKLSSEEDEAFMIFCNIMIEGRERGRDPYFRELCQEILDKIDNFKEYLD